jgi:hypothetical protein
MINTQVRTLVTTELIVCKIERNRGIPTGLGGGINVEAARDRFTRYGGAILVAPDGYSGGAQIFGNLILFPSPFHPIGSASYAGIIKTPQRW